MAPALAVELLCPGGRSRRHVEVLMVADVLCVCFHWRCACVQRIAAETPASRHDFRRVSRGGKEEITGVWLCWCERFTDPAKRAR